MKKVIQVAGICCLLATGCFGQRMGFGGFRGGGFRGGGFGRVSGGFAGAHFGRGFGGFGGFGGHVFVGRPFFHHRPFFRFGFFPRFFPGFFPGFFGGFGGFGYPGYGGFYDEPYYPSNYGGAAAPNVTVIYLPPASSYGGPEMIASQPSVQEYRQPVRQAAPPGVPAVYFQIAMKDGSVYAALAYWVEDGGLHYIDFDGTRRQVRLNDVDRERSENLNKKRQVDFRLPPAR